MRTSWFGRFFSNQCKMTQTNSACMFSILQLAQFMLCHTERFLFVKYSGFRCERCILLQGFHKGIYQCPQKLHLGSNSLVHFSASMCYIYPAYVTDLFYPDTSKETYLYEVIHPALFYEKQVRWVDAFIILVSWGDNVHVNV